MSRCPGLQLCGGVASRNGVFFLSMPTKLGTGFRSALSKITDMIRKHFIVEKALGIMKCERVVIQMFGGEDAQRIYRSLSAPHRKFPIVGSKTLGVALSRVPENPSEIFQGKHFHEARRKKNRAAKAGFAVKKVAPMEYFESIYAINTSKPIRQSRPLEAYLANKSQVLAFCEESSEIYGCFGRNNELVAYAHGTICGDVFVLDRFIGNHEYLDLGIMFLINFEILTDMVRSRELHGVPHWIQHDMYFVASAGARQFKKEAGFSPYRVKWVWDNERILPSRIA